MLWSNLIDVLRGSLFVLAHWCGGSVGASILIASTVMRVALLPLTLPATRRRLIRERQMRQLAPHLAELNRRYAGKPDLLFAATRKVHEAHGVPMFDRRAVFDSLVSFPPAAALYSAIRGAADRAGGFLWVADLAKPDRLMAAVAGIIAGASAWTSMTAPAGNGAAKLLPIVGATAITFLMLSHFSAGVALYSVSNSIIGAAERAIAARTPRSSVA
jgi:membrane protein insertase Oxa1/YidC/SpoIIIJ